MNTARSMYAGGGSGSYTAALAATGLQNGPDSNLDVVESWNGTSLDRGRRFKYS